MTTRISKHRTVAKAFNALATALFYLAITVMVFFPASYTAYMIT
ncbi:hypothetical protein [Hyphomonas johnsonii]|jgi:hypothetical protein|nr:hypothetical protein [Hyphomonas johnsonii]